MFDLNSMNPNPLINYDGISKNVTAVGFHSDMKWMFTGGEDNTARIWDLRYCVHAPVCFLDLGPLFTLSH